MVIHNHKGFSATCLSQPGKGKMYVFLIEEKIMWTGILPMQYKVASRYLSGGRGGGLDKLANAIGQFRYIKIQP